MSEKRAVANRRNARMSTGPKINQRETEVCAERTQARLERFRRSHQRQRAIPGSAVVAGGGK